MRKAIAGAVLLLGSSSVTGQVYIMGIGGVSCGEVLKQDTDDRFISITWVQGYLSGINSFTQANGATIGNLMVDFDAVDLFIQKYCESHPLDKLHETAWEMGGALYNKTR